MLCLLHCFSCRLTGNVVPLFLETPHQLPTVTHPHSGVILVHNGPLLVQATSTHYSPHTVRKLEGLTILTRLMKVCRSGKATGTNSLPEMANHLGDAMEILGNSKVPATSPMPGTVNHLGDIIFPTYLTKIFRSNKVLCTNHFPETVNHLGDTISQSLLTDGLGDNKVLGMSPLPEAKRPFPIKLNLTKLLLGRSGHPQTTEQGTHFHVITKKTYFGNFLPFKQIIFLII